MATPLCHVRQVQDSCDSYHAYDGIIGGLGGIGGGAALLGKPIIGPGGIGRIAGPGGMPYGCGGILGGRFIGCGGMAGAGRGCGMGGTGGPCG